MGAENDVVQDDDVIATLEYSRIQRVRDKLKEALNEYETANQGCLASKEIMKLKKKVKNAKKGRFGCFECFTKNAILPHDKAERVRYFEEKILDRCEDMCSAEITRLSEITAEYRSTKFADKADKNLLKAHTVLYTRSYRKDLLSAVEARSCDQLKRAIQQTYNTQPLQHDLRHELGQAERMLDYVMKRDKTRRRGTWKFEYDGQQAGYNLSYWIGRDQHWFRNEYRVLSRPQDGVREVDSKSDKLDGKVFLQELNDAITARDVTLIRAAILRIDKHGLRDEYEKEVTFGEKLIEELERKRDDDVLPVENDPHADIRARLQTALLRHNIDIEEVKSLILEYQQGNMDDDDVIIQARDVVLRHQLREALHTAMHTKDINNIQQAIDDVDGARMRDVMNDDVIQAEELIRILQAERDAKARLLLRKKELARAIKPPDVITPVEKPDVTPVVNDVIIPIVDEREAEVAMMKQLLAEAMTSNNVTMLEIAMQRILDAGLYDIMKGLFDDATMTLELWKDRIAFKKSVADIPARYVSEVRSYTNPPPGVHHVMQATFILLGFNESQLKTWKDVQSRLGRGGTDSFRYRVVKRSVSQINQSEIERAREILYDITIDDAQNLSLLVNLFYRYCQATMEEWDANIDNL